MAIKKTRHINLKTKVEVLLKQALCAHCGCSLACYGCEWDHVNPHKAGGSNEPDNVQALCISCHDLKTNGPKATSAGSDKNKMAKIKRIQNPKKSKFKIPSRKFPKNDRKKNKATGL